MRSKAVVWTLVGLAAAVVLVLALSSGNDETGGVAAPGDPAATETPLTEAPPQETTTSSTTRQPETTTTTLASSTTTTTSEPPTTTSTPATAPPSNGYAAVPKPATGPNTIAPGGALTKHLAEDIASSFGFDLTEVEAAIAGVELPPEAGGILEGWPAPGTYQRVDGASAAEIVQAMVDRRVAQLEARNVPRDEWHRVVTAASVIEKETYNQNEKPRVARVLTNRLAGGGPLQMDSIILYPVPEDRIFTTSAERASEQPYNSYRHHGLPPTPICSPDEASIDAFLAPPPGDWWFYVTIDLHSGETRYAITYEEHQANVELLRAWLRDNPTK